MDVSPVRDSDPEEGLSVLGEIVCNGIMVGDGCCVGFCSAVCVKAWVGCCVAGVIVGGCGAKEPIGLTAAALSFARFCSEAEP